MCPVVQGEESRAVPPLCSRGIVLICLDIMFQIRFGEYIRHYQVQDDRFAVQFLRELRHCKSRTIASELSQIVTVTAQILCHPAPAPRGLVTGHKVCEPIRGRARLCPPIGGQDSGSREPAATNQARDGTRAAARLRGHRTRAAAERSAAAHLHFFRPLQHGGRGE